MKLLRIHSAMRVALLIGIAFLISNTLLAQLKFQQSKEFGVMAVTSYYIGDINPYKHFGGDLSLGGGVVYRENLSKRWSVKGTFIIARFAADDAASNDAWRQNRNLSFRNDIREGSIQAELNYFNYQINDSRNWISPYLFLGLAFYSHKPQAEFNGRWYELQPLGTEGQGTTEGGNTYNVNGLAVPFGAGLKMNLFSIVGIGLEWGMRKTWTDYLDDVSQSYVSPAVLADENGTLSAILADRSLSYEGGQPDNAGLQRGDPGRNDWYNFTTLTLSFRLGKKPTTCWNR